MKRLLFILCIPLLVFTACDPVTSGNGNQGSNGNTTPTNDWTAVPGQRVGPIKAASQEADIIDQFGESNVIRKEIGVGEREMVKGTVVYPETEKELIVVWESDQPYRKIDYIRIEQPGTPWKTDQGITVGTTFDQLQTINGKPFDFYGFEWDYAGLCKDWNGGAISNKLNVYLDPENPEAIFPELLGEGLYSSDHPKVDSAQLKVIAFAVEF